MWKVVLLGGQPQGAESTLPNFSEDSQFIPIAFDLDLTKFGKITHVGEGELLEGQLCPHPKRKGPQCSKIFLGPYRLT